MIAIRGWNSAISQRLLVLLPEGEVPIQVDRGEPAPTDADRYLFAAGALPGRKMAEEPQADRYRAWDVNFADVVIACDRILAENSRARICVVGSESGFAWSYDDAYAGSKAALHRYVETKRLQPDQQLVCVAPTIIGDAGMTLRRNDPENVERRANENPKRRHLTATEVAKMVKFLLYDDLGYTTGIVIRMNGGPV